MEAKPSSLRPIEGASRPLRRRLKLPQELALALIPTIMVLGVFGLVEAFSKQRLLFASLAASAFLIYLDPQHGTNRTRTLVIAQTVACLVGFGAHWALGGGYKAAGVAMVVTIYTTILLDAVHPPAIATALSFAFDAGTGDNLALFALALLLTVVLVIVQRASVWLLARYTARDSDDSDPTLKAAVSSG